MARSDAQKRAEKKWRAEHLKNITLSVRKEFAAEIDEYLKTEAGTRFRSRSHLLVTLLTEQMDRDGFEHSARP